MTLIDISEKVNLEIYQKYFSEENNKLKNKKQFNSDDFPFLP